MILFCTQIVNALSIYILDSDVPAFQPIGLSESSTVSEKEVCLNFLAGECFITLFVLQYSGIGVYFMCMANTMLNVS